MQLKDCIVYNSAFREDNIASSRQDTLWRQENISNALEKEFDLNFFMCVHKLEISHHLIFKY